MDFRYLLNKGKTAYFASPQGLNTNRHAHKQLLFPFMQGINSEKHLKVYGYHSRFILAETMEQECILKVETGFLGDSWKNHKIINANIS